MASLWEVKDVFAKVKAAVLNYTEYEAKVHEATNNEAWGASSSLMQDISQGTMSYQHFNEIMPTIYKRFTDKEASKWRQIYKALTLLEYLIKNGSERVVDDAREHISLLKSLRNFHFIDETGKDQGINVRKRAGEIVQLLSDTQAIKAERIKAKSNKTKYKGYASASGSGSGSGFSSGIGGTSMSGSGGGGGGGRYSGFGNDDYNFQGASFSSRNDRYKQTNFGDDDDDDQNDSTFSSKISKTIAKNENNDRNKISSYNKKNSLTTGLVEQKVSPMQAKQDLLLDFDLPSDATKAGIASTSTAKDDEWGDFEEATGGEADLMDSFAPPSKALNGPSLLDEKPLDLGFSSLSIQTKTSDNILDLFDSPAVTIPAINTAPSTGTIFMDNSSLLGPEVTLSQKTTVQAGGKPSLAELAAVSNTTWGGVTNQAPVTSPKKEEKKEVSLDALWKNNADLFSISANATSPVTNQGFASVSGTLTSPTRRQSNPMQGGGSHFGLGTTGSQLF